VSAAAALRAIHGHPRHVVLFAFTTGLLLGPISPAATILAAVAVAGATALAATTSGPRSAAGFSRRSSTLESVGALAGSSSASARASGFVGSSGASASLAADAGIAAPGGAEVVATGTRGVPVVVGCVAAAAVMVGALVAELRVAALEGGQLPGLHGRAVAGRAVVLEPFRERSGGPAVARARLIGRAVAAAVSVADEVAVLRVRPAVHPGAWPDVGEIVDVAGTVAPLGRYDAYQRRRGAGAAVEVSRLRATGARRGGAAGLVDAIRRRAEAGLTWNLPPPRATLLRGMVLGQDDQLSDATRDDFERSGLAHVLAVSGQNVMLLATLVLAAGALTGLRLRARLVLALALVAVYVPLTGAGPSIQRAGVMGAAGLVAALAGRPAHRWYALGLAAAVTLAVNPRAAGEPGWQLSFAAVVALLALAPMLRGALAHVLPGPVADVAAITISATVGTAPLMALHFGQVSLAALPANLLAAAAIAPIMWLGMLAAAAAQVAPALAAPFNAVNAPLLAFVDWVAHTMAAAPMAVLPVGIGSPAALAVAYAALAAAIMLARATCRHVLGPALVGAGRGVGGLVGADRGFGGLAGAGRGAGGLADAGRGAGGLAGAGGLVGPGGGTRGVRDAYLVSADWRRPPPRSAVAISAIAVMAVVLLIAASSTGGGAPPAPGELVVSFLDVGQGDATLIQLDGAAVLVDTGPPAGPIVRRLVDAGVKRLDALVLTHAQSDHEGAALAVMRAFPPRLVVNGGAGWPTGVQRALPEAIAAAHSRRIDAHAGQILVFGAFRMRLLWPPPPGPAFRPEGDPNDRALVAHVESGDFDLLLPADAESNVTAGLDLPQVEALKVAHHGSADEGLPDLLDEMEPEFAAIEVGRGNPYGHPTASTLGALRAVPQVFRTDRDGTIRLRVRGDEMRVERSGWFR
jgi:competence protein ComEC